MSYALALVYVFVGGGLGSVCRFSIGRWLGTSQGFPVGTFIANLLACFVLGLAYSWLSHRADRPAAQLLIMAGFCGGFSTFSTFTLENYDLLKSGDYGMLALYVMTSLGVCMIGLIGGLKLYAMLGTG